MTPLTLHPDPVAAQALGVCQPDLRVVVLEHHDALRAALSEALGAATKEPVRSVSCWREFAGEVASGSTDLVVLDLDLPQDGGLQACRQTRALHPQAHLIAMSSSAQRHEAAAALEAGADQLLIKPISTLEITAHMTRLRARRRAAAAG